MARQGSSRTGRWAALAGLAFLALSGSKTPPAGLTITNLRTTTLQPYQVDTIAVGKPVYIDRAFTFTRLPAGFAGLHYIRTANNDKGVSSSNLLSLDVNMPAVVIVAFDARAALPSWMTGWADTGLTLTTTDTGEPDRKIYLKLFPPGRVVLGGAGLAVTGSNYSVILSEENILPPPTGDLPLDLVIFNESQRNFFLGNRRFVHPGDSFMVLSGNSNARPNRVTIDTGFINDTTAQLHNAFTGIEVYAATAGSLNVRRAAERLSSQRIKGIMIVWEPDRPDHPDLAFDRNQRNEVMRVTRNAWNPLREYCHQHGMEFWGKPSGKCTKGGSKQDIYDYGEMALLTDGLNVQTQGACKDGLSRFRQAADGLVTDYARAGANVSKGLFLQVTVSTEDQNQVTPARGLQCANYAWSRMPPVTRVTMWWSSSDRNSPRQFLELREDALASR